MLDQNTLATAGKWAFNWAKNNPDKSIPIGTSIASSLYRFISPDRGRQLQMDVLDSQQQFRDRLARQAFGNFTAAERQQIQAAAEPQVNQVAANVSTRGLGTSGAGAQIISQAQQAPLQNAQQQALQVLPQVDASLLQGSQLLMDDGSFIDDLGAIARELALADQEGDDTSEILEALKLIYMANGSPMPSASSDTLPNYSDPRFLGQGYQRHIGG